MDYAGTNLIAVVIAGAAGFIAGGLWYGLLGKHWLAATGLTEDDVKGGARAAPMPFVVAIIADLVMAAMLAGIIGHLGTGQITLWNGLVTGLFVWIGFVATTISVNYAFAMRSLKLTVIDTGHWLFVLLVMGAVIGAFGN